MCTANINSYDEAASTTVTMSILGIVRLHYCHIRYSQALLSANTIENFFASNWAVLKGCCSLQCL